MATKPNYRKIALWSALIVVVGVVVAIGIPSGGGYSLLGKIVGLSSQSSGNGYTLSQTVGESVGISTMSGGGYELTSTVSVGTASKLEANLALAHCYPNPYKPSAGHTKITFSRMTHYTKLQVYNVAGELVYNTEGDTPTGELNWDVRNNSGDKLASGVYIYMIADGQGNRAKGKFAVIK
jgi:hypothetical protein